MNPSKILSTNILSAFAFGVSLAVAVPAQNVSVTVDSTLLSNIEIEVNRADENGRKNGRTKFVRSFKRYSSYTLTAPKSIPGSPIAATFHRWEIRDAPGGNLRQMPLGQNVLRVSSIGSQNDLCIAHYIYDTQVSIRSIGASEVPIEVSKPDAWGNQNGKTQFFRKFLWNDAVNFTAPLYHGKKKFYQWSVAGVRRTGSRTLRISKIGINFQTFTAVYGEYTKGEHSKMGVGCTGSNGPVTLTPRYNPDIGLTTQYRLYKGPSLAGAALLVGVQPANVLLPGTSCRMAVNALTTIPVTTNSDGYAMVPARIPNDTGLIGINAYTQYVCVDVGANSLHLTLSDAYRTKIGGWKFL